MIHAGFEQAKQTQEINNYPPPSEVVNNYKYSDILTQARGFDLPNALGNIRGPSIEIGGPTFRWNDLLGVRPSEKTLITNQYDTKKPELDLQVNARDMPFDARSVGILFASGLPHTQYDYTTGQDFNLRHAFFEEARRCLEPNGILVTQSLREEDVVDALQLGLTPIRMIQDKVYFPGQNDIDIGWDCVFINAPDPGFEYTSSVVGLSAGSTVAEGLGGLALAGGGEGGQASAPASGGGEA